MAKNSEKQTKNDKAWQLLFDEHDIVNKCRNDGSFEISSKEINKHREARLMTKFDHKSQLPKQFSSENLTILPNKRGSYIIGNFDVYQQLKYEENIEPKMVSMPHNIETIDPKDVYSESLALNVAHISGMLSEIVNNEKLELTVSGRMSSKEFSYKVFNNSTQTDYLFTVENSQIEIDGSYESESYYLIIESKLHSAKDFLARQLYYPYRTLEKRTNKKILPVFFTLSNDVYSFFVYEVTDLENYNSLKLIKQYNFMLEHEKITSKDLKNLVSNMNIVEEPEISFPQADSFERVIDLLSLLVEKDLSIEDITVNYDFDERQSRYYTSAGMYLGLIEKYRIENKGTYFRLTDKGNTIMTKNIRNKYLSLASEIVSHKIFKWAFEYHLKYNKLPDTDTLIENMEKYNLYKIKSYSTFKRRSSTVIGWIKWIINLENK